MHRYKNLRRTRRKQSTRESDLRKKHKSAPASTTEERERELLPSDFFLTPPVFFLHETDRLSPRPSPRSYRPTPPPSITSPFDSHGGERATLHHYVFLCKELSLCFSFSVSERENFLQHNFLQNGKGGVFFFSQKQRFIFPRERVRSDSVAAIPLSCEASNIIFLCFFFLSRFYLSIKIFSTKKTLSRNFVSDVQTKSATICLASNCNMSENFKSYVHILKHIDNECCCEGSSTNQRGPVLSGESQVLCLKYLHLAASVYVIYCKELHSESIISY